MKQEEELEDHRRVKRRGHKATAGRRVIDELVRVQEVEINTQLRSHQTRMATTVASVCQNALAGPPDLLIPPSLVHRANVPKSSLMRIFLMQMLILADNWRWNYERL